MRNRKPNIMNITITNSAKADLFGLLFQHIRLFTEHVNITFDKERMFMQSMDSARVSVFELTLPYTWFDVYEHTSAAPITLGIPATMLFKVLNTRDKIQETQIIYDESDNDKLFVNFSSNNASVFNKRFELPLIDLECEIMQIPPGESDAEFSLDSSVFANLINQLKIFGDTIEIHATARCLGLDENILKFEVEVHQVARLIATGLITRKFVERVSFMARVAAETMMAEKGVSVSEKKVASSLNF